MANKNIKHSNPKSDNRLSTPLREEIQNVRNGMFAALPQLNSRFQASMHPDRPAYYIMDTETGNITERPVGLYAMSEVVRTLNSLFPEG